MSITSNYVYIDFTIQEGKRFDNLQALFNAIKAVKDIMIENKYNVDFDPLDKMDWLSFLDDEAMENQNKVFDYNSEEGKTYLKLWELTEPKIRLSHPFFRLPNPWDYEAILDAIFNGEYILISIEMNNTKSATLYFEPWAGPFGGTESLVALIELFGHQVIYDNWHNGPHRRLKSKWNYERAKELVKRNTGVKIAFDDFGNEVVI